MLRYSGNCSPSGTCLLSLLTAAPHRQAGLMAGWAFQCLQLEPQWEPVSLGLYIELPRDLNGGWRGKTPHTDHPRSPTVYNTPKMIGSVCLDPCWSQFCIHCHPMGNVSCCGGVRANKYSRS